MLCLTVKFLGKIEIASAAHLLRHLVLRGLHASSLEVLVAATAHRPNCIRAECHTERCGYGAPEQAIVVITIVINIYIYNNIIYIYI